MASADGNLGVRESGTDEKLILRHQLAMSTVLLHCDTERMLYWIFFT